MDTNRARRLLELGRRALADARYPGVSAWRRLQAAYDSAVCAVAVLADRDIKRVTIEEEGFVLEKLLQHVSLDAGIRDTLRQLAALRCRPPHLHDLTTKRDVENALQVVVPLHRQAVLKLAR